MTGDINPNLSVAEQEQLFDQLLSKVHPDELLWRQHFTTISTCIGSRRPAGGIIACNEFLSSPVPDATKAKRQALALDCEMVGVESGLKELAYLAVVDILTGEVLVNAFVSPTRVVQKWNTRWSGIRYTDMKTAVKKRVAIKGWKAARSMLFEHMDSKTILAGHALHNDLNVLGILHPTIVDTAIMSADEVYRPLGRPFRRTWSLKSLTNDILGYEIQGERRGHSALEDTVATRGLLIHCN